MARPRKYTKATLHALVPVLIETGIYPGIREIQERLGGGTDTIARDLREMGAESLWEIAQGGRSKRKARLSTTHGGPRPRSPDLTRGHLVEEDSLLADIEDLRRALSELKAEIAELKGNDIAARQTSLVLENSPHFAIGGEAPKAPFQGMSISDAAIYMLHRSNSPMSTMKIAYTLEAEGFKFVKEPSRAVNNALLYRSRERKDVIKVGYSTWGLPGRDTPGNVRSEGDYSGKVGKDYQVARMQLAHKLARERGTSVGRPAFEKSHPFELIQEFRRLREFGASLSEALKACGISRTSYTKYRRAIEDAASVVEFEKISRKIRQKKYVSKHILHE